MKERPILFSGPMVRALHDGSKTQTRRVVKSQPPIGWDRNCWYSAPVWGWTSQAMPASEWHTVKCPFGEPGDRLWVRETHDVRVVGTELFHGDRCVKGIRHYARVAYRADDGRAEVDIDEATFERLDETESKGWAPSIHMPRWASRITLEVTSVRVERLHDISEQDAAAEGVESLRNEGELWKHYIESTESCDALICLSARESFRTLWDSLAAPGADWQANPWVWVVEFKRAAA